MRLFLFLFLLILPISGYSQISNRLDSLRIEVLFYLNLNAVTNSVTAAKLTRAINHAIVADCKRYPALYKLDTVIVPKTVEGAALNSDFSRPAQLFKMIGDSIRIPLQFISWDSVKAKFPAYKDNVHNPSDTMSPAHFWTGGQKLFLHPKYLESTSDADSFIVHYYAIDQKLSDDTNTVSITQDYRLPLIYYAAAEIWSIRGRDDKFAHYMGLFLNYIPQAIGRQEVELK